MRYLIGKPQNTCIFEVKEFESSKLVFQVYCVSNLNSRKLICKCFDTVILVLMFCSFDPEKSNKEDLYIHIV